MVMAMEDIRWSVRGSQRESFRQRPRVESILDIEEYVRTHADPIPKDRIACDACKRPIKEIRLDEYSRRVYNNQV